ncbi:MAG: PAS domain S-box protein, partial [Syntrophobacteraceae bacterium]|nr:PAS domain S-box protein [Syntrophobacteraceae bacterium]
MEQIPGQPLESFPSASSLFLYVQDTLERDGAGVTQHIAKEFGYSIEEAECAGVDFLRDFVHPEDTGQLDLLLTYWEKAPSASSLEIEMRVRHADGNWRWIRLGERVLDRLADGRVQRVIGACCDVTRYKAAEERARTLTRLYAIRSCINQAIVHVREPLSLFREACRIAVEEGAFRMAWVGLADEGTKEVEPVAWAGVTDGYLEKLKIVLHDEPHGRGPTGRALKQGLHVVCRDIEHDPSMEPWRAEALQRGYRSSAAFPLKVFGQTRGALNLYASEPGAFGDEVLELLDGLAMDLSFALEYADQESLGQEVQEALRASEERFRAFFHNAGVGMAVVDKAGCVVVANEADARFLGYHPDELAGMHFSQFTHPDDLSADAELYQALLRGDRASYTIDKRYLRKDGQTVWGHLAVSLVRDAAGSPLNTVVVCEDITEQKRLEEGLRKSEEQLSLAIQGSGVGFWDWMIQAGEVSVNDRWAEIVGYKLSELVPLNIDTWMQLCHPDDLQKSNVLLQEHFTGKTPYYECEARMKHKDGRWIWILDRGKVTEWDRDGRPLRMTGTHLDITERK